MQADRFTIKTREALEAALALARARRHSQITPAHLLTALLNEEGGFVTSVLGKIGVTPSRLRGDLESALGALPTLGSEAEPTMAPEVAATLRTAEREMRSLKDSYVSVEHVLLALTRDDSPAGKALKANGATHEHLLQALAEVRPTPSPTSRRRRRSRHSSATAATSPPRPTTASSTPSSGAMTRSAASSRSSAGARRTTRC